MAFRFQKRLKVLPGLTLNLSKKGVSTSIGTTGARVTYGHGKKRTTVGIPGTGLSHTNVTSNSPKTSTNAIDPEGGKKDLISSAASFLIKFMVWAAALTIIGVIATSVFS